MRGNTQGIAGFLDLDKQIIVFPTQADIAQVKPFKTNDVLLANRALVVHAVADAVLARAFTENVGVRTITTVKAVVARTTIQHVIAIAATERVITCAPQQCVIAILAV
ncbi:hypothetical protein ALQ88_200074 [Pseudomonas savastanoi]|nr:hypothetical protein ALQ88_200074 [Pseudomonas savastanoi]